MNLRNRLNEVFCILIFLSILPIQTKSKNTDFGFESQNLKFTLFVPAEGNCWTINNLADNDKQIRKGGIRNWVNAESTFRTYFKTNKTGELWVGILAKTVDGFSEIEIKVGEKSKRVSLENSEMDTIQVGLFQLEKPGYCFVEMKGVKKEGEFFPEVAGILLGGEATSGKVWFAKDDFYWGRRGPSVHLNFQVPEQAGNVLYFYNEITIPENNDVLGSYFMANGFGQGYFGMQVNSEIERRILFSVWSPFKTDNPQDIPDEQKIKLLKKGENVHAGEFGNEGSGGQSYFKFMWKTGVTYKFLLKGEPTGKGETDFTAWFFAPEKNSWKLIASFRRPKTDTYLTHLYSFLENFYTSTGHVSRKGYFGNQWIYTTENEWLEISKIKFTADATARKESRMDYAGGSIGDKFFLENCGFFSETTLIDSYFERNKTGKKPEINFNDLP